jgi:hypothetical protein
MRRIACTTAILILVVLGPGSRVDAQVSIGITIGPPPAPRVVYAPPPVPGPNFVWVEGYWYPVGNHYKWHNGYWTRPPYESARWIGPRYDGERFYEGYWEGERGHFKHDHHWDREKARDFGRHEHDHDER